MTPLDNSFRLAFMHLKMSLDYFQDFSRQNPNSRGSKPSSLYAGKLEWCLKDFKTNIDFPADTLDDFIKNMNEDPLALGEIGRLANKLSPNQRIALEEMIKTLLAGEKLTIVINDNVKEEVPEPNY